MAHIGPILEGIGDTDYERYVRVRELLALQKPADALSNPEERLFQITHQAAELWFKQIEHEIGRIEHALETDELETAAHLFGRCSMIIDLLRTQIELLETMAPADYHVIRTTSLGRGSGQESPGFRNALTIGQRIWPKVQRVFEKAEKTPLLVLREPRKYERVHRLIQSMMDFDASFLKWRYTHMKLAERIIGSRVSSLKGVPVNQLEAGTREALFPRLWDAVNDLTEEFKPEY